MWRNDKGAGMKSYEHGVMNRHVAGWLIVLGGFWIGPLHAEIPAFMQEMEGTPTLPVPTAQPDTDKAVADSSRSTPGERSEASVAPKAPDLMPMNRVLRDSIQTAREVKDTEVQSPRDLTRQEQQYLDELRRLKREEELWELRNRVLDRQRAHRETEQKIQLLDQPSPERDGPRDSARPRTTQGHVASAYDTHIAEDERALASMRLVSVFGDMWDPKAEIYYGGARMRVARGERLPGDWRVSRIEMTRVVAEKGARQFEIGLDVPGGLTRRLTGSNILSQ